MAEGIATQKQCPACEEWLDATPKSFYRSKGTRDGLTPRCKGCHHDKSVGNRKIVSVTDGGRHCSLCGEWKPLTDEHFTRNSTHSTGFYSRCKPCRTASRTPSDPAKSREYNRKKAERRRADPEYSEATRDKYRERRYGVAPGWYAETLAAQGGLCAICRKPEAAMYAGGLKELAVDHNHSTGAVRELLCSACNVSLGGFSEDIQVMEAAIAYLLRHIKLK